MTNTVSLHFFKNQLMLLQSLLFVISHALGVLALDMGTAQKVAESLVFHLQSKRMFDQDIFELMQQQTDV